VTKLVEAKDRNITVNRFRWFEALIIFFVPQATSFFGAVFAKMYPINFFISI
jgi:hypothetical protein